MDTDSIAELPSRQASPLVNRPHLSEIGGSALPERTAGTILADSFTSEVCSDGAAVFEGPKLIVSSVRPLQRKIQNAMDIHCYD